LVLLRSLYPNDFKVFGCYQLVPDSWSDKAS